MSCSCNTSIDIRGRCYPKLQTWKCCPARLDTALFQLQNERDVICPIQKLTNYDDTLLLTKNKVSISAFAIARDFLLKKMKLSRTDANRVIDMWIDEIREEEDC